MAVPKPKTTNLTEQDTRWEIMTHLRSFDKDIQFSKKELFNNISEILNNKYGNELSNQKYYRDVFGFAISHLKKDNWIKVEDNQIIFKKINPREYKVINIENINWDTKQTISSIYDFIDSKKHLLPSFQRGTAWTKPKDYRELAYSIYKSVPLGLMYFWKINKEEAIKMKHLFFKRSIDSQNPSLGFEEVGMNQLRTNSLFSIIDGQQRITGINVIVSGTLDNKKLYFNDGYMFTGSDRFAFKKAKDWTWNSVEDIFNKLKNIYENYDDNEKQKINEMKILSKVLFIRLSSLNMFYNGFFKSKLLAICELPKGELEEILQVFIRTNSFGKKLQPADIMKSMLVGNDSSLKRKIDNILKIFKKYKPNFKETTVLKLLAVYFTGSPHIDYTTFFKMNKEFIKKYNWINVSNDKSWDKLSNSIESLFTLFKRRGFDSSWISSDNSLIPIIDWIAKKHNSKEINDQIKAKNIIKYMLWSQSSKYFGSSTDAKINKLNAFLEKDELFSYWQDLAKNEISSLQNVIERFKTLSYSNSREQIMIRLILTYANETNIKISDDSIEHLQSQSKNGPNTLGNLSLLPSGVNSSIGDNIIEEKVYSISRKLNISIIETLKFLHITEKEMKNNKIDESRRIENIVNNFYKKTT